MTRFYFTSLVGLILFLSIGYFMTGWSRVGAFTAFWIVYLTIVGCGVGFIQLAFFGPVICRGKPGNKRIALTFDDGPDPIATPALLDLLRKENVQAVFFCIGKNVAAHPQLAAQIAGDGHLIGNHTFNHGRWTPLLGRRGLTDEIVQTQQAIVAATGITPIYFRPPVGLTNPHYKGVLKRLGMQMIGWDVRSMDTRWETDNVIARVLRQAKDGSIILLHDGGSSPEQIVKIVAHIIRELRASGFVFARLDRLIAGGEKLATDEHS